MSAIPTLPPAPGEGDAPAPGPARVLTRGDVARHNSRRDCWVVLRGRVLDVSGVVAACDADGDDRACLLLKYAGDSVDHLFDRATGQPLTRVDPATGLRDAPGVEGALPGTHRAAPTTGWDAAATPWWEAPALVVGVLSARPRARVVLLNTLTGQEEALTDVADERSLAELAAAHFGGGDDTAAGAYEWRAPVGPGGAMITLDPSRSLSANGLTYDDDVLGGQLELDPDEHPLTLALVYADDARSLRAAALAQMS
jgi:hypothetical protein